MNVLYLLHLILYEHLQINIQNFIKKSMENYIMVSGSLDFFLQWRRIVLLMDYSICFTSCPMSMGYWCNTQLSKNSIQLLAAANCVYNMCLLHTTRCPLQQRLCYIRLDCALWWYSRLLEDYKQTDYPTSELKIRNIVQFLNFSDFILFIRNQIIHIRHESTITVYFVNLYTLSWNFLP